MFRERMPLLVDRIHVVAPDLPGFGRTAMPARDVFEYTFDNFARVVVLLR
ncbi:Haloalkane dehalogenase [Tautonia plasticadhaerens]|uniref:Haloalkane dehalogenase n=1 Tax=Tautonia plasticadhaerens TaxID=2527974 RepID=A0A518GXX8_9BACT|nr:Haloalkane dehalogenase [Tautonia plasticadhaerens]